MRRRWRKREHKNKDKMEREAVGGKTDREKTERTLTKTTGIPFNTFTQTYLEPIACHGTDIHIR